MLALDRARAAGVRVVACTGRPCPGARPRVERLRLRDPFACYQGAQVRDLAGRVLLDSGVPRAVALEVVRWCRERDIHVQAYRDDRLLVERDRPEAREYAAHAQMELNVVPSLDRALGPTTPKLVIVAAPALVERILPEVRAAWKDRLYATTSMPSYLEMTLRGADKGNAVRFLAGHLGVAAADTVAVGDGRNDIPMLRWAGLGVAVAGAGDEVRAAAQMTVAGPGEGGIQDLVESLL